MARPAEVSTATVDRVPKAVGRVSSVVRARVDDAARRIGDRPDVMARRLRMNRSFALAHIVTAIIGNPFFANLARGADDTLGAPAFTHLGLGRPIAAWMVDGSSRRGAMIRIIVPLIRPPCWQT